MGRKSEQNFRSCVCTWPDPSHKAHLSQGGAGESKLRRNSLPAKSCCKEGWAPACSRPACHSHCRLCLGAAVCSSQPEGHVFVCMLCWRLLASNGLGNPDDCLPGLSAGTGRRGGLARWAYLMTTPTRRCMTLARTGPRPRSTKAEICCSMVRAPGAELSTLSDAQLGRFAWTVLKSFTCQNSSLDPRVHAGAVASNDGSR